MCSEKRHPQGLGCELWPQLWPGAIYWPDYLAPAAVAWYTQQLTAFYKELPLDGVWLDMDEPSNFCTGDVCVASGLPRTLAMPCQHAGCGACSTAAWCLHGDSCGKLLP